jgi:hypothetical protein
VFGGVGIDSSSIRAHQHSAGAGKGGCVTDWVEALAVDGEALGRSRGGLTRPADTVLGIHTPGRIVEVPDVEKDRLQITSSGSGPRQAPSPRGL